MFLGVVLRIGVGLLVVPITIVCLILVVPVLPLWLLYDLGNDILSPTGRHPDDWGC